jgi:hypothetical protein
MAQNLTLAANTPYVFSCFLKADQLSWALLQIFDFSKTVHAYINLATGALGSQGADNDNAIVEDYGNGWYRLSVFFTTAADVGGQFRLYVADGNNDITVDLDGTSSILMWGAQVEPVEFTDHTGQYIKTTTAQVIG